MPLINLPKDLQRGHILDAAKWIDQNGVPPSRKSDKYAIAIDGTEYPPPFLGQVAVQMMTGVLVAEQGRLRAGPEMFEVFSSLGFEKVEKGSAKVHIGSVEGIVEGDTFDSRKEVMEAGLHRQTQAGIDGHPKIGAGAIVLSGGYEDDFDEGELILYTGAGGQDTTTKKQVANQTWSNTGNASLHRSFAEGLPVRVIRGASHKGPYSPKVGYRYAGLYLIEQAWMDKGKSGFVVCRFKLVKCEQERVALLRPKEEAVELVAREPEARYAETTVQRRVRDTALSRQVKELYDHRCQACGFRIETPGGHYAEGAHIRPLGKPHLGDDSASNLLCLCPNHHVLFDRGAIGLTDDLKWIGIDGELLLKKGHEIDIENVRFHREMHQMKLS